MKPESNQARILWIRLHNKFEALAFRIMQGAIRKIVLDIPFAKMTRTTYKASIPQHMPDKPWMDALTKLHYRIGVQYAEQNLDMIDQAQKAHPFFAPFFQRYISKWLARYGGRKIVLLKRTLADWLIDTITDQLDLAEEEENFETIASLIYQAVKEKGFYKWQIQRIVRTETTSAMNNGTLATADTTGIVLEKVWYSADDTRTRRHTGKPKSPFDHLEMDGRVVAQGEKFKLMNYKTGEPEYLEYPGDPTGSAGNIINCRCRLSMRPKKDANGNLIITNRPGSRQNP